MATSSVQIKGLRELGEALKLLGDDMALKVSRAATGAGAQVVKKEWKAAAPVADAPYRQDGQLIQPGNIGKNVISKRLGRGDTQLTSEHIVTVRHKGAGVKGQPYRAAILTEFGTVNMSADPWARPAFERSKGRAVDAIVSRLKTRIDKASKGGK